MRSMAGRLCGVGIPGSLGELQERMGLVCEEEEGDTEMRTGKETAPTYT